MDQLHHAKVSNSPVSLRRRCCCTASQPSTPIAAKDAQMSAVALNLVTKCGERERTLQQRCGYTIQDVPKE